MQKLLQLKFFVWIQNHAHALLPAMVMISCLAITYQLWVHFNNEAKLNAARLHEQNVDHLAGRITQKITLYSNKLEALKALFIASENVSQEEFDKFVATLRLHHSDSGVRALGFMQYIPGNGPDGLPEKTPITYITPDDPENIALIGLDPFSDSTRRSTLIQSLAKNSHAITEPIQLIQDIKQSGEIPSLHYAYIMVLPIYKSTFGKTQHNPSKDILGWVYVAFRLEGMMNELLQNYPTQSRIKVFDQKNKMNNLLVYERFVQAPSIEKVVPTLKTSKIIAMNGRSWQIESMTDANYLLDLSNTKAKSVAITGSIVSILLGWIFWLLSWRVYSLKKIQSMHTSLLNAEQRWKFALEGAGDGVWDYYPDTGQNITSRKWKELLGYAEHEIEDVIEEWSERIHPDDYPAVMNALDEYISGKSDKYTIQHRMRCKDGSWKWILSRGMAFERDDQGKPTRMVGTITDLSNLKASEALIWHQANFDALTGIPNRRYFFERLENEVKLSARLGHHFALLFIDLDEFKTINDQYGHQVGDQVLITISARIKDCVRETDTIARLGGDEFTVILSNLPDTKNADIITEKILSTIRAPIQNQAGNIELSASIGVSLYSGQNQKLDMILNCADRAMYQAKLSGKNGWQKATDFL